VTKEKVEGFFNGNWDAFYARFVTLPTHNGHCKISSPIREGDKTPSFKIDFEGEHAGRWYDFGLGEGGSIFDFYIRMGKAQTFADALKGIASEFGIVDEVQPNWAPKPKGVKTLAQRGISEATTKAFQIVESSGNKKITHSITFPILDQAGEKVGDRTHKSHQTKGITSQLYPWKSLEHDTIYIVNGEPSIWRSWEDGYKNVICGTGGEGAFKKEWIDHFKDKIVKLVLDNDETGRQGMQKIGKMFNGVTSSVEVVNWPEDFTKKGDVEDWLNAGHRLEDLKFDAYESKTKNGTDRALVNGVDTWPYQIKNGCLGYMKVVGRGEDSTEIFVPLGNFSAWVAEEVSKDDGAEVRRVFHIEGKLANGTRLPCAEVTASQFSGMKWLVSSWGIKARMSAGQGACDRLREGIQVFSRAVKERIVYVHSGWRQTKDGWIFLHQGGAIGARDVETELEGALSRYRLPEAVEDVKGAVRASLSLLDVAEHSTTYPMLLSVFLAPLAEVLNPDFSIWLYGVSGSMKSTLAALFMSHYGDFDWKSLPGSWESTANALEKHLFQAKDVLFAIDDFAPQPTAAGQARQMQAIARVVRAQGNLAGRSRMNSDMSLHASYPPRGVALMTGEDLPSGQSLMARLLTVEVERRQIDIVKLTQAQKNTFKLTEAMWGYINYLAPQMDGLKETLTERCRQRRTTILKDVSHLRTPEILANLLTAWDMFLDFAQSVKAITEDEAHRLFEDAWTVLVEVAKKHSEKVRQVDPAERFIEIMSDLFASESIYVENRDVQRRPDDMKPNGEMVGWADVNYYYFLPEAARKAVGSALRASGDHWPHSKNALYQSLQKRNVLACGPDGKNTFQIRIQGKKQRVMRMPRSVLDMDDEGNGES
jgi:hypothetical protein